MAAEFLVRSSAAGQEGFQLPPDVDSDFEDPAEENDLDKPIVHSNRWHPIHKVVLKCY